MENDATDDLMFPSPTPSPTSLSPVSDDPILLSTDGDEEEDLNVRADYNGNNNSGLVSPPRQPQPVAPTILPSYAVRFQYHQYPQFYYQRRPRYEVFDKVEKAILSARAVNYNFGSVVNSSPSVLSSNGPTPSNNNRSNQASAAMSQQGREDVFLQYQLQRYMYLQTLCPHAETASARPQPVPQQNETSGGSLRNCNTSPPPQSSSPLPSPTSITTCAPKILCRNCFPSDGFSFSSMRHSFIRNHQQSTPEEFCCKDAYIYSVAPWRRTNTKNLDPDGSILRETIADNNAIIRKFNELCVSNPKNVGYSTVHVRQALEYDQQQAQGRVTSYMYYNDNSVSNKGNSGECSGTGNDATNNSSGNNNNNTNDTDKSSRQNTSNNVGGSGGSGGSSVSYPQGMWAEVGRCNNDNNATVTQLIHNAVRAGLSAGAAAMNNMQQQNQQQRRAHAEMSMAPPIHSSLVKRSAQGEFMLKLKQNCHNNDPPMEVLHQRSPRRQQNDTQGESTHQRSPRHQYNDPAGSPHNQQSGDPPVEVLHQKPLQPTGSSEALLEETKRQMNETRRTSLTRPQSSPGGGGGNRKMNDDLHRDWDYRHFGNSASPRNRGQKQTTKNSNEESYNTHIFGVRRDYVEGRHFVDHDTTRDNFFAPQHNRTTSLININLRPVNLATPPCAAPRPKKPMMGMNLKK